LSKYILQSNTGIDSNFFLRNGIFLILTFFILISSYYSIILPTHEAPDEWVHILWIKNYATMNVDDWTFYSHEPLYYFTNSLVVNSLHLTDHLENPPVRFSGNYPFHWLHGNEEQFPFSGYPLTIHLLRFYSIVLGAITVFFTYKIAQLVFGKDSWFALFSTLLVTLIPTFVFTSAIINNDILGIAMFTISIFYLMKIRQNTSIKQNFILLGIFSGLAIISKGNTLILLPIIISVIIIMLFQKKWNIIDGIKQTSLILLGSLVGIWYPIVLYFNTATGTITSTGGGGALNLLTNFVLHPSFEYPLRRLNIKLFDSFWAGLVHINVFPQSEIRSLYLIMAMLSITLLVVFYKKITISNNQKQMFSVILITLIAVTGVFSVILLKGTGMARNILFVMPEVLILISFSFFLASKTLKTKSWLLPTSVIIIYVTAFLFSTFSYADLIEKAKFEDELKTNDPLKNMILIWKSRTDLPKTFPEVTDGDYKRFNNWILTNGLRQYPVLLGTDKEFFQLLNQYYVNDNIQEKFPEAKTGNFVKLINYYEIQKQNILVSDINTIRSGLGSIDSIDGKLVRNTPHITTSLGSNVVMQGWMLSNEKGPLDLTYLFIDDKPISQISYGFSRPDVAKSFGEQTFRYSGWTVSFSTADLDLGCYDMNIVGVVQNSSTKLTGSEKLCIVE